MLKRKKSIRLWTKSDIELLKNNSSKGLEYLSKLFPYRTKTAILYQCRFRRFPLTNKINKAKNKWSEDEIKTLKQFSKKGIDYLIQKLPNRTQQAIRTKCTYLNLDIGNTCKIIERLFMVV